jgi:hypothetical protein
MDIKEQIDKLIDSALRFYLTTHQHNPAWLSLNNLVEALVAIDKVVRRTDLIAAKPMGIEQHELELFPVTYVRGHSTVVNHEIIATDGEVQPCDGKLIKDILDSRNSVHEVSIGIPNHLVSGAPANFKYIALGQLFTVPVPGQVIGVTYNTPYQDLINANDLAKFPWYTWIVGPTPLWYLLIGDLVENIHNFFNLYTEITIWTRNWATNGCGESGYLVNSHKFTAHTRGALNVHLGYNISLTVDNSVPIELPPANLFPIEDTLRYGEPPVTFTDPPGKKPLAGDSPDVSSPANGSWVKHTGQYFIPKGSSRNWMEYWPYYMPLYHPFIDNLHNKEARGEVRSIVDTTLPDGVLGISVCPGCPVGIHQVTWYEWVNN